ncbi:MAG TPA: class I SAM-dependent methyltransferase [Vicinamibacterales bacterium]|nr:class I SAM-dependent methyltransferase [Vicinamibacterales bacterium]HOQ61265.1 class I SAM-dependent methyltransferase [Vicinamibacterales bacterium]HPK71014.1 class I SAM-dependent methyltransferase [Vicinamibacterales bacterium]
MADGFYTWFTERRLTRFGGSRRQRIERSRLALLARHAHAPGDLVEIGPGTGSLQKPLTEAGWRYRAIEASPALAADLRSRGADVIEAWAPPFPLADASSDVVYADQVLEHMNGIEGARAFAAESFRVLRPGGVLFVVVPDYLKERTFFWDVDYTHNFVTTERRVRQLLGDHGFRIERVVRSIGASTGIGRDLLAAASALANVPGLNALSRWTKTEDILFRVRKNFFETLAFVARKPAPPQ